MYPVDRFDSAMTKSDTEQTEILQAVEFADHRSVLGSIR